MQLQTKHSPAAVEEIHVKQQQEIRVFRHLMWADYAPYPTPDLHWNKQDFG